MESERLLTVEEAAEHLRMHAVTVRKMLREHRIVGLKLGPRQWRIKASELQKFINSGAQSAPEMDQK